MNGHRQASAVSPSLASFALYVSLSFSLSRSLLISRDFGPSWLDAPRTNEDGMNAITSRHCRLFCARYYLPVFAHVVIVVERFLSFPPPSSLLCCFVCSSVFISVDDYFDDVLADSVYLVVTHAGIFARTDLVCAFSLSRDRGRI